MVAGCVLYPAFSYAFFGYHSRDLRLFAVEGVGAGVAGGRVGAGIDVEAFR